MKPHARFIYKSLPRLPLTGSIDLTYRCNNDCRHCWAVEPNTEENRTSELTTEEWLNIIDQARVMGTREWMISGGEPMLREDFRDIFSYLKKKSIFLSVFSNGTLITSQIARQIKGSDLQISLYGATEDIFDYITRKPGSFDKTMRGISCLREHGVPFTIRAFPMKDNFHQWPQMLEMADKLADNVRIGAGWLYLSAVGDEKKNKEICEQRLLPHQVIEVDAPNVCYEERREWLDASCLPSEDDRLFAKCMASRNEFHIDPNGFMSFCPIVKNPAMRFDVRKDPLSKIWEYDIPALAETVRGGKEFMDNCGSCQMRKDCRWCSVYSYLEHRENGQPVDYLCHLAKEKRKYLEKWKRNHRRYFEIAGISIQVDSDRSFDEIEYSPNFDTFKRESPSADLVRLEHHYGLPDVTKQDLGKIILDQAPWRVYDHKNGWVYILYSPSPNGERWIQLSTYNKDYTHARIFNNPEVNIPGLEHHSLASVTSDQIWIAHVLSHRQGFYLHSSAMVLDGHGLLFVGPSGAGKSTTIRLFEDKGTLLCDDRNIVRRWSDGWHVHGTWSHGEIPIVSDKGAPLKGIFFLEQSADNRLLPIDNLAKRKQLLLPRLVRPVRTPEWWEATLPLVYDLVDSVPCYIMNFDKSGEIVKMIESLIHNQSADQTDVNEIIENTDTDVKKGIELNAE